jgi:hypothetical protein
VLLLNEFVLLLLISLSTHSGSFRIHLRIISVRGSRDSSFGIALGYGLDDRGSRVRFSLGTGNFSLHHLYVQNGSWALPASYPIGTRGSFPGGEQQPGHEADPSPPSSAEVKE